MTTHVLTWTHPDGDVRYTHYRQHRYRARLMGSGVNLRWEIDREKIGVGAWLYVCDAPTFDAAARMLEELLPR